MDRSENFISGSLFFGIGLLILWNWRFLMQSAINSGNSLWSRLGVPQSSERIAWIGGQIIVKFIGLIFCIGGVLMLYSAFTGHDWPLHHAKWSDLWPFN